MNLSLPQLIAHTPSEADTIPFHDPMAEVSAAEAETIVGGLSKPGKMPCFGTSLSAKRCNVGTALRKVKGSTCKSCYACRGNYAWPTTVNAMERRYRALWDSRWTAAMVKAIRNTGNRYFRWHDSGDLQSVNHFRNIVEVARHTPEVRHWLPTREYAIVRRFLASGGTIPANLIVRASAAMMDATAPADFHHTSEVAMTDEYSAKREAEGVVKCIAYTQGGKCLDCRACWSSEVQTVIYPKH